MLHARPPVFVLVAVIANRAACPAQSTQTAPRLDPAGQPPPARIGHVAQALNGNLYVCGGLADKPREDGGASAWRYEPAARRWTPIAPMPTPRVFAASAVVGGQIIVLGGIANGSRAYSETVEAYDPRRNIWEKLPNMQVARSRCGAAAIAEKIYVVSGLEGSDDQCRTSVRLDVFDPATRQWTRKRDIPHGRHACAAVAFDERLYVLGGYLDEAGRMTPCNLVESYDPKSDTWRAEPPLNCRRSWFAAVACDDSIVALGGMPDGPPGPERFARNASKWDSLQQPDLAGRRFAAAVIRDEILVTGGEGMTADFLQTVRVQSRATP